MPGGGGGGRFPSCARFRPIFWRMQSGGMTCLDDEGMAEIEKLMDYYLENARILKEVIRSFTLYPFLSRYYFGWRAHRF